MEIVCQVIWNLLFSDVNKNPVFFHITAYEHKGGEEISTEDGIFEALLWMNKSMRKLWSFKLRTIIITAKVENLGSKERSGKFRRMNNKYCISHMRDGLWKTKKVAQHDFMIGFILQPPDIGGSVRPCYCCIVETILLSNIMYKQVDNLLLSTMVYFTCSHLNLYWHLYPIM